ncbi:hypothetical protein HCZ30_01450 [Marivivens donghaensis]|uniref:VWFA domain-containing protein n=1 Tax=Marivivens donghaensis TaxID=1699413 RepID=A0ABX0VTC4_9RHOB|nr:pilus assembly protein TadG-related protein [Marivivens donghaensis]NIY71096.1 hypothetical protein [Marivivens donghaensis]
MPLTTTKQFFNRFRRDEDGSLLIFGLVALAAMLLLSGLAIDFIRIEGRRAEAQGVLDTAVLAAADLDQTQPAATVVRDYLSKKGMLDELDGDPVIDEGLNYRTVEARLKTNVPLYFSTVANMFAVDDDDRELMQVPSLARAQERVAQVEISLVLDISGSMALNNRLPRLKSAATDFVNTVLEDGNGDLVSVSLVPYSEQVNIGPYLSYGLNRNQVHDFSYCWEFPDSQFRETYIRSDYQYQQMQHFQWNFDGRNNDRTNTVCPRYDYEWVQPWSNNRSDLINQINRLQPRAGTAIYLGMKWGTALLDPSLRWLENVFIDHGLVDSAFRNRPNNYDDEETLKFVVLMTDGENSNTQRIQSWAYDGESEYAHWNDYNFNYYLRRYVDQRYWQYYYYEKYTQSDGNRLLSDMCDAAKDAGIVVWTIGFEVDTYNGNQVMSDCASTPNHFFDVDGVSISDAFHAIATQINNLKLTR